MRAQSIAAPIVVLLLLTMESSVGAKDWPTWRHDPSRSSATDEVLAKELHLQWTREQPPLTPAWPEDTRLHFDAHYEPIVAGKTMFVSSSHSDSVSAVDTETGELRWRYHAGGPVRFAPVAWQGRIYFGSDDGHCYCLDAKTGTLVWNFNGAPSDRLAIGNERLISIWPARTGPVILDDRLYFTVGVWPFEGTLLYTLDANSGKMLRTHDLRDQAPQGYLVASDGKLFIPCGRSKAYGYDLASGKQIGLKYDSRGKSDYHVTAMNEFLFHGDKIFDVKQSRILQLDAHRPVAHGGHIYATEKGAARGYDLTNPMFVETTNRRGEKVQVSVPRPLWQLEDVPVTKVHLRAGNHLYAHHGQLILGIQLPADDEDRPEVIWNHAVRGNVATMIAADEKLFVVTQQGAIHCFGPTKKAVNVHPIASAPAEPADKLQVDLVRTMLKHTSMPDGYGMVLGIGDGKLVDALLEESKLRLVVVDPDATKVGQLRERLDRRGSYGQRISVRVGSVNSHNFPPYMASLITSGDIRSSGLDDPSNFARQAYACLRPYGGAACFAMTPAQHEALTTGMKGQTLPNMELQRSEQLTTLVRVGALPDTADWTHEYGDPANTLMSRDKLVKAPLGILWFGGPSASGELYYDRHDWAPSMAVINGRMFVQGPQKLTAVDVYTGRLLWQRSLPVGISPGRRSNWKPSGFHFLAVDDGVYLTLVDKCLRLDPATGELISEFSLPEDAGQWGAIRVWKHLLIVEAFGRTAEDTDEDRPLKLLALDRTNGELVWSLTSELGFPLIAIDDDRLFLYEGKLAGLYQGDTEKRRGGVPTPIKDQLAVKAFDVRTGKPLWSKETAVPASWLSFSKDHDVLLMSNRNGIEAMSGQTGDRLWARESTGQGFRGHPENYWDKVIIWKDQLLDQRGPGRAYHLLDGKPVVQTHPLTGQDIDWEFTKIGHHCNYAIANEFLMTFRADSAGFCDLASGETARLNGFRPGCRNSLIPANGVLNAPNYGHGCICAYSLFTSLALVHVPDADVWSYSAHDVGSGPIQRLGINFGAPGDRRDADGTMWLDYPNVGGPSPKVNSCFT